MQLALVIKDLGKKQYINSLILYYMRMITLICEDFKTKLE